MNLLLFLALFLYIDYLEATDPRGGYPIVFKRRKKR